MVPAGRFVCLITNRRPGAPLADLAARIRDAVRGGVGMVQLREKGVADRELYAAALAAREALDGSGVPLIVNDRTDVALLAGAAGVHLGQTEIPIADARLLAGGRRFVIGATAWTVPMVRAAAAAGADYLGCGAVFKSRTKSKPVLPGGPAGLTELAAEAGGVPLVAIGGITPDNAHLVAATGAIRGVAAASALYDAPDVAAAVARMRAAIGGEG